MSSELVRQLEPVDERAAERRRVRVVAIEALGPVTMLGGIVWALAQPYRIAFFYPEGKTVYDWLGQPPLLVLLVGLLFALFVAPGLVADMAGEHDAEG